MRHTLKVLSALLTYPTADLQAAIPELRLALEREAALPRTNRARLDRIIDDIATGDIYDLQERYILLFDRTRTLSLHLFEHVHCESRDRGQAMVDLAALYTQHGVEIKANELPDYLPLFLEFLSLVPAQQASELIGETAHVLQAVRMRLKKRKSPYSSVFSSAMALADFKPSQTIAAAIDAEPADDPNDLDALDKAWMDEEVRFGPSALACGKDDLASKLRAGNRPAPDMPRPEPKRPIITHTPSTRS